MRAAADVGGTFTDILFRLPGGEVRYHKTLSTPPSYDDAVVAGVAHLLRGAVLGAEELGEVIADAEREEGIKHILQANRKKNKKMGKPYRQSEPRSLAASGQERMT